MRWLSKKTSFSESSSFSYAIYFPSYPRGDVILTIAYLINRMSFCVLHLQTPLDCLKESYPSTRLIFNSFQLCSVSKSFMNFFIQDICPRWGAFLFLFDLWICIMLLHSLMLYFFFFLLLLYFIVSFSIRDSFHHINEKFHFLSEQKK